MKFDTSNHTISIIVAMDMNRLIGRDNGMPWKISHDWQYVKAITMGCPIIMGRKNYQSIGRPLPGRKNIILTRDMKFTAKGCEIAYTLEDALMLCKGEREIFVFGGSEIYELFLPIVDILYITRIHDTFIGDTYFPEVDFNEWDEISCVKGIRDEKNDYDYYFHIYKRGLF